PDRLQRDLSAFLLAEQRLFVELALRDVGLDPDQALEPAMIVDSTLHAALDPAPFAAGMAHAVNALEELGTSLEVIANLRLYACHVVGVHEETPLRHTLAVAIAEHGTPARREVHG